MATELLSKPCICLQIFVKKGTLGFKYMITRNEDVKGDHIEKKPVIIKYILPYDATHSTSWSVELRKNHQPTCRPTKAAIKYMQRSANSHAPLPALLNGPLVQILWSVLCGIIQTLYFLHPLSQFWLFPGTTAAPASKMTLPLCASTTSVPSYFHPSLYWLSIPIHHTWSLDIKLSQFPSWKLENMVWNYQCIYLLLFKLPSLY